jgi:hypothetical protein
MNNAVIANYLLYFKDLELFESVYNASGKDLVRAIGAIRDTLRTGEPFEDVRTLAKRLETQNSQAGSHFLEAPNRVDVGGGR